MDWTNSSLILICELMAEQVKKGNRPNTHLNTLGNTEVFDRFFSNDWNCINQAPDKEQVGQVKG
jgi:hypothetical protein